MYNNTKNINSIKKKNHLRSSCIPLLVERKKELPSATVGPSLPFQSYFFLSSRCFCFGHCWGWNPFQGSPQPSSSRPCPAGRQGSLLPASVQPQGLPEPNADRAISGQRGHRFRRPPITIINSCLSFPGGSEHKESASNAGDGGSIPGLGRSPGGGHGNPLQYSCLENPRDRGAWWAAVHGVTKSWTRLSD